MATASTAATQPQSEPQHTPAQTISSFLAAENNPNSNSSVNDYLDQKNNLASEADGETGAEYQALKIKTKSIENAILPLVTQVKLFKKIHLLKCQCFRKYQVLI